MWRNITYIINIINTVKLNENNSVKFMRIRLHTQVDVQLCEQHQNIILFLRLRKTPRGYSSTFFGVAAAFFQYFQLEFY